MGTVKSLRVWLVAKPYRGEELGESDDQGRFLLPESGRDLAFLASLIVSGLQLAEKSIKELSLDQRPRV